MFWDVMVCPSGIITDMKDYCRAISSYILFTLCTSVRLCAVYRCSLFIALCAFASCVINRCSQTSKSRSSCSVWEAACGFTLRCWHVLRSHKRLDSPDLSHTNVCVLVIEFWHHFRQGLHTHGHLISVRDNPRRLWPSHASFTLKEHLLPPRRHAHAYLFSQSHRHTQTQLSTPVPDKGYCCQMTSVKWLHVQRSFNYGQEMPGSDWGRQECQVQIVINSWESKNMLLASKKRTLFFFTGVSMVEKCASVMRNIAHPYHESDDIKGIVEKINSARYKATNILA